MKRTHHPPLDWSSIRWPDFAAGDAARWIAILPLAATEQHGPHLPLGTDTLIAEAYLAEVRATLPPDIPATFLAVQNIGISTEHLNFPGTLSLPPDVALQSWIAVGEGIARAGLRKLVIVTSHGGNSAAMGMVAQELRARHAMLVVTTAWSRLSATEDHLPAHEVRHGVHGGAAETSLMLARYPDLVRKDKIADFRSAGNDLDRDFRRLSMQRPAPLAWQAEDLHPSGAAGDATLATPEIGEALLRQGARAFCELLSEVHAYELSRLGPRPA